MTMNFEQTKLFGMFAIPGSGGEKEYATMEVGGAVQVGVDSP
jgi:hypothetical protein